MSVSLGLRAGFGPTEGVLEQLQAILREQEVCVGEQVANVEVAGQDDLGSGQVLKRAAHHVARRGKDYQRRVVKADCLDELRSLLGARLLEAEAVDHPHPALDRLLRES